MPTHLNINGVWVSFPHKPYDLQTAYMSSLIKALNEGTNAMLESPTGTGKTLCLLCASIAWREQFVNSFMRKKMAAVGSDGSQGTSAGWGNSGAAGDGQTDTVLDQAVLPKIIYATRTHTQIAQTIAELKRTKYKPKICVLGSREQMCINKDVLDQPTNAAKTRACRNKVSSQECSYYFKVPAGKQALAAHGIADIEDLVKIGKEQGCCPYYLARDSLESAEVIFAPYNYLINANTRRSQRINVENAVVIFDEAHNIESVCEDASSFDLSTADLAGFSSELSKLEGAGVEVLGELTIEDVQALRKLVLLIEQKLDAIPLRKGEPFQRPGTFIFEFFGALNITFETAQTIIPKVDEAADAVAVLKSTKCQLSKLGDILRMLFGRETKASLAMIKDYYYVNISESKKKTQQQPQGWAPTTLSANPRTISFWCFSSSFAMKSLVNDRVRSVVLTSGTLSPLDTFAAELMVKFPVMLENPHIITRRQVWASVVTRGPSGCELNASYATRSSEQYQTDLGNTIANFARVVPKGVLVFFPSYGFMKTCIQHWQHSTGRSIWDRIAEYKKPVVEPQNKHEFVAAMEVFYEQIRKPNEGSIFFAVCRGKVSEGLDFADDNGRAVIITGLPYPAAMDARVLLKKKFLDRMRTAGKLSLSGQHWYRTQATRAVNQAIGRVIRHRRDYGAIILADSRFTRTRDQLPAWLRSHVQQYRDFGEAQRSLRSFFANVPDLSDAAAESAGAAIGVGVGGEGVGHLADDDMEMAQAATVKGKAQAAGRVRSRRQTIPTRGVVAYDDDDDDDDDGGAMLAVKSISRTTPTSLSTLLSSKPSNVRVDAPYKGVTAVSSALRIDRGNRGLAASSSSSSASAQLKQGQSRAPSFATPASSSPGASAHARKRAKKRELFQSAQRFKKVENATGDDAREFLAKYVKQVKRACTPEVYVAFAKAIKEFQQTVAKSGSFAAALPAVARELKRLFVGDTQYLLYNFDACLPPSQRVKYKELLRNLPA